MAHSACRLSAASFRVCPLAHRTSYLFTPGRRLPSVSLHGRTAKLRTGWFSKPVYSWTVDSFRWFPLWRFRLPLAYTLQVFANEQGWSLAKCFAQLFWYVTDKKMENLTDLIRFIGQWGAGFAQFSFISKGAAKSELLESS